jgi:hypothetical protein
LLATVVRVGQIGAGQVAAVAGMTLQTVLLSGTIPSSLVDVLPLDGTVILHDLATAKHGGYPAVAGHGVARLVLSRSTLVGGDEDNQMYGLRTTRSRAFVVDSELSAPVVSNPTPWLVDLHHIARVIDSELYLAGCTLLGPDILLSVPYSGGDAIDAQSSLVVADRSSLLGGQGGGGLCSMCWPKSGGYGARLQDSSLFASGDTLVQGGLDDAGLVLQEPVLGPGYFQSTAIRPTLSASPALVQPGDTLDVALRGEPGARGVLLASLSPGAGAILPGLVGDVFIDPASPIHLGIFALDATGEAHLSFLAPAVAEPTLATFQWAAVTSSAVQVSNPAFVSLR